MYCKRSNTVMAWGICRLQKKRRVLINTGNKGSVHTSNDELMVMMTVLNCRWLL